MRAPERPNINIITDILVIIVSVSWEGGIRETLPKGAWGCPHPRSKHLVKQRLTQIWIRSLKNNLLSTHHMPGRGGHWSEVGRGPGHKWWGAYLATPLSPHHSKPFSRHEVIKENKFSGPFCHPTQSIPVCHIRPQHSPEISSATCPWQPTSPEFSLLANSQQLTDDVTLCSCQALWLALGHGDQEKRHGTILMEPPV